MPFVAENSRMGGVLSTRKDDLTGWSEYEVERLGLAIARMWQGNDPITADDSPKMRQLTAPAGNRRRKVFEYFDNFWLSAVYLRGAAVNRAQPVP